MLKVKKILVTTVPFGATNKKPLELLNEIGLEVVFNPLGRRLTENELIEMIPEVDILIAGTEPITGKVLNAAKKLKLISRVGIGLDNVDLNNAKKRGVLVTYTPDAPSSSVAELTICQILALLRLSYEANFDMHRGIWNRYFGRRIGNLNVGIIGVGRIGVKVLKLLSAFEPRKILVNDILGPDYVAKMGAEWSTKDDIFKHADIITLHVPLTAQTKDMISHKELSIMKKDAILVNTSRGGIINESALRNILASGHLHGVALDVFDREPYGDGPLSSITNCLLTSHMGSMSFDSRELMELEAVKEVVRFFSNRPLQNLVPDNEYDIQREFYE